ncbi:hypothetical protein A2W24_06565 [Microgenomates group bacterium RBG_16_45_19]|nr:MAG: hypothetical protein A2W24_06565 [Microgenomates group bacterium RBG_16_45_19]
MKAIDKWLFVYSAVITVTLTAVSLTAGFNLKNLLMTALFLPLSGYFAYQLLKAYYRRRYAPPAATDPLQPNLTTFSLKRFLTQNHPTFLVTLSLYLALIVAFLVKTLTTLPQVLAQP